jgi:hypothetical protein
MTYTLTINDVEQNLSTKKLSLESLESSWVNPRSFRFVEHVAHNAASYSVEDEVVLSADGTVRFRGRVKRIDLDGVPNAERVVYTCLGLRELAKSVTVHDPTYGFPRVVFNAPADDDDYDAARSDQTVGEIIEWLFDQHVDELRALGIVAASPATGYVQADLDALSVVPPKVVFDSQDFDAALADLMDFQRGYRFIADPATQTFRFKKVATLSTATITYNSSDKPLSALLRPSTERRATAVEIVGPMRPVNATVYLSTSGLTKLWTASYESDWTWAKCFDPDNDNSYGYVFRRFQITNADRRRMAHSLAEPAALGDNAKPRCPQVYRKTAGGSWAWVPSMFDFESGVILLSQPATSGDESTEGEATCASNICLVYSYLTSPLSARAPASGYEGTAYTEPDNAVEVVRRVYDENFTLSAQQSDYAAWAQQLLDASKDIVYAGSVALGVLDWSLAGLDRRLNFTAQDDDGDPITTGFESLGAVLLSVRYRFAESRTELTLSTDLAPFVDTRLHADAQLRELATQARRGERYRALHACAQAPTPRAGNDGEPGAASNAGGVHSIRRYEDSESLRVAGHVDLESGDGITITRQVDANHNGFKVEVDTSSSTVPKKGQWYWFTECLECLGVDDGVDPWDEGDHGELGHRFTFGHIWKWYPVPAGKVRYVIARLKDANTCDSVFAFRPVKMYKGEGAVCPDTVQTFDTTFETTVDKDGNTSKSSEFTDSTIDAATDKPIFDDGDWLGCRVYLKTKDASGVTLGADPLLTVGVYVEET